MTQRSKFLAVLWIVLAVAIMASAAYQSDLDTVVDSNILNLFPQAQRSADVNAAVDEVYHKLNQKVVFVVSHESSDAAIAALVSLKSSILPLVDFELTNEMASVDNFKSIASLYHQSAAGLMSAADYRLLSSKGYSEKLQQAQIELYSPVSAVNSSLLSSDPFFFFSQFMSNLTQEKKLLWEDGWPYVQHDQKRYFLLTAKLKEHAFNLAFQEKFSSTVASWKELAVGLQPTLEIFHTGTIFFATDGAERAKKEISTVGLGSLVGIVVLLLIGFRSFKVLLITGLSLLFSIAFAASVVVLVYSHVHLLALVFGATLIGISIDYSFHFYAEFFYGGNSSGYAVQKHIRKALALGLVSSVAAYSSLLWGGFPGLHQIAVFSMSGLMAAFLNVVFVYPVLFKRPPMIHQRGDKVVGVVAALIKPFSKKIVSLVFLCLAVVLIATGLPRLTSNDDVRLLQPVSPELREQQGIIEQMFSVAAKGSFFVIKSKTIEELLVKEEKLIEQVEKNEGVNAVKDALLLSDLIPSKNRQRQVIDLKKQFYKSASAESYLNDLGLNQAFIYSEDQLLTVDDFKESSLALQLDNYLVKAAGTYYGVAYFPNMKGGTLYESKVNQVYWIDRTSEISAVFKAYRVSAAKLLVCAIFLIGLIFSLRYGVKKGVVLALIPIITCLSTLSLLGLMGINFNLFHLLGLMVVLGLGLDYAVFLKERRQAQMLTMLAIMLSVVTTLLAFGLLYFSGTPAVSSFGVVVWVGILITFVFSTFLVQRNLR